MDLAASLARFSAHGDDLMDRWDGLRLLRGLRAQGRVHAVRMTVSAGQAPTLRFELWPELRESEAAPRLSSMFLVSEESLELLCRRDAVIAKLRQRHPGLRPVRALDPLAALLAMVTSQQVNLRFACAVRRAILLELGEPLSGCGEQLLAPAPERFAAATPESWRSLRLTQAKGRCLTALGQAICSGQLELDRLERLSDREVELQLRAIPGIGPWTVAQFLGRVLGRPILVASDLGVRKAVQHAYRLPVMPSAGTVEELTAHYGEAAWAAQQLLLRELAQPRPT